MMWMSVLSTNHKFVFPLLRTCFLDFGYMLFKRSYIRGDSSFLGKHLKYNSLVRSISNKFFLVRKYSEDLGVVSPISEVREFRIMNKLIKKVNECLRTYRESPFLIFIDVGAHIGKYSVQFFDKVHKVVAIEPDPNNFALLKINIRLNKAENIIPLQLAAGAVEQYAKLYSSNLLTGRTYITMRDERVKRKKNVEEYIVKVMRVEDILKRLGLMQDNIIYIVKIDVEGYEEKVLKGMSEVLPKTIILMIETSYENFRNVLNLLPRTFYLVASFYYPKTINLIFIQRKMVNAI